MENVDPIRRTNTRGAFGFTLIELLVVLGIIFVLAALLFGVHNSARNKAIGISCMSHLRQLELALQLYVQEYGNRYPFVGSVSKAEDGIIEVNWFDRLEVYSKVAWTNRSSHCAGYKGAIDAGSVKGHDPRGSYAYNWRGVRGYDKPVRGEVNLGLGLPASEVTKPLLRPRTIAESQVKVPSEMFAIGESRFRGEPGITDKNDGVSGAYCGYLRDPRSGPVKFPARHGKRYYQSFCDGHVASFEPSVLFNPTNTAAMWNNDHEPHREAWPTF